MNLVSPIPSPVLPRLEDKTWSSGDGRVTRTKMRETPGVADPEVSDFDLDHFITEDEQPVDNFFSAKQQRLLVESLYSSWAGPSNGPFLADTNVGVFATARATPVVPDVFLSLNVQVAKDWWQKRHRSYLLSEFHKPPDVVIEIVSNREGNEDQRKLQDYANLGIRYYLIFDPIQQLKQEVLRLYELRNRQYVKLTTNWLAAVGLGVTLWTGTYEQQKDSWLRWCDVDGNLILTGAERAALENLRANWERQEKEQAQSQLAQERQRADHEQQAKEHEQQAKEHERQAKEQVLLQLAQERQQKERFLAQLRSLGIEPAA